jgi:hypothetical protein
VNYRNSIVKLSVACVLTSGSLCRHAVGANMVLVRAGKEPVADLQALKIASQFYGLDLRVIVAGTGKEQTTLNGVGDSSTVAVAIQAGALSEIDRKYLFRSLRQNNRNTPIMIVGITPETGVELLKSWSNGAVTACRRMDSRGRMSYRIHRVTGVTRELSDLTLPIDGKGVDYLSPAGDAENRTQIISAVETVGQASPVFVETAIEQRAVFLESRLDPVREDFAGRAAAMMFTKYCAGAGGWHGPHHYANLTIDDPWLREPYGFVDYALLSREMGTHHFHTTIAFIPWNYDRSDPEVISLFRKNPAKLSLTIHGDNHDHKEFTDYRTKPLAEQIANLKQSLARMDRFRELTGIPYDKIMIFPHSIAPEQTLTALKENGYLATVNSSNVPVGAVPPPDPLFNLRVATLDYGGSLSLRRYSVEAPLPPGFVPLNLFLDNPLLFYCHEEFFSSGIGAFDEKADAVNRIDPEVRWRGLGDIVRHMYLTKQRDDGDIDVLSFTPEMSLENPADTSTVLHVRKQEHERPRDVKVNGQPWPYLLDRGYLEVRIPAAGGKTFEVSVTYGAGDAPAVTQIGRRSVRVYALRMASDFRDITLGRCAPGRWFIRLYQQHGQPLGFVSAAAVLVLLSLLAALWRARLTLRSRHRASETSFTD